MKRSGVRQRRRQLRHLNRTKNILLLSPTSTTPECHPNVGCYKTSGLRYDGKGLTGQGRPQPRRNIRIDNSICVWFGLDPLPPHNHWGIVRSKLACAIARDGSWSPESIAPAGAPNRHVAP